MGKSRTSVKKGQVLNPKGAPYAWETFRAKLRKYNVMTTDELYKLDLKKIPVKDVIAINQIKKAVEESNQSAINWISERDDGKVEENLNVKNTDLTDKKLNEILKNLSKKRKDLIKKDDV